MDILFRVVFFRRSRRGGGESATDHPTCHLPVPARRLCGLLGRRHRPDAHVALLFAGKMTKRKKNTYSSDRSRFRSRSGSGRTDSVRLPATRLARGLLGGQHRNSVRIIDQPHRRHVPSAPHR